MFFCENAETRLKTGNRVLQPGENSDVNILTGHYSRRTGACEEQFFEKKILIR